MFIRFGCCQGRIDRSPGEAREQRFVSKHTVALDPRADDGRRRRRCDAFLRPGLVFSSATMKNAFAVTASLVVALLLGACGGGAPPASTTPAPGGSATTAPTDTSTAPASTGTPSSGGW